MVHAVLALTLALLPLTAGAATLRTSLPSHVPAQRSAVSPVRAVRVRAALPPHLHAPRRETARALAIRAPRWPRHIVAPEAIHVYDGDTFYVGADAYRLRGIDTPELGQPRADGARRRLIALLNGGLVTIVPRAEDVYGRIVADVYAGGRDVARALRAEGYAKPRPPHRRPP